MMGPVTALLVLAGAFLGGMANSLAGGGSFITIPLLLFAGLPPAIAIGTNRVALVFQTATASMRFRHNGKLDLRKAAVISLPAVVGAVIGARIVLAIPTETLETIIAVLLFVNIPVIYAKDRITSWLKRAVPSRKGLEFAGYAIVFVLGAYNGFFGAGVGFFLISAFLVLFRQEVVSALATRSFVAFASSVTAAAVFIAADSVDYSLLVPLTIGFMSGAWLGAGLAIKRGERFVKAVLTAIILITCAKLLL